MILIGEKINGTRKSVLQAILDRDEEFIADLARRQAAAGAAYLDINAGTQPDREPEDMAWLVELAQRAAPEVSLCLDSANPEALAAGLKICRRPAMLNSLSGEKIRLEGTLPLAVEHGAELVVLALDDQGIPESVERRLAIVRRLVGLCREQGLADEKLYIDPLVLAIATGVQNGRTTLETMRAIKAEFPKTRLTCGHSNISFGLPLRSLVNQAFMALTVAAGLDSAIMDPENRNLVGLMMAAEAALGLDRHCLRFSKAARAGKIGPV